MNERTPIITRLDTVEPVPVDWLWEKRLASGKYTLLAGEPGVGKTYLALDCCARISRGTEWPDGTTASAGNVLFLTAEDSLSDTVRPRIELLGGDASRVFVLEAVVDRKARRPLNLSRDIDLLMLAVRDVQPRLVVIDPISAYLGRTDAHRDSEVRGTLAPLIDLIEQQHSSLLAIGHLSKDQQRAALHRPSGSIAFVAAARIVLAVAADQQDPERRVLAPIKSNLCRPAAMLAYRVTENGLNWEHEPVTNITAEQLLRPTSTRDHDDVTDAERFLRELMQDSDDWPLEAKIVLADGRAQGITERTLQWTAKKLGITIRRVGFGSRGKWIWKLPTPIGASTTPEQRSVAPIAPMAQADIKARRCAYGTEHSGVAPIAPLIETTQEPSSDVEEKEKGAMKTVQSSEGRNVF